MVNKVNKVAIGLLLLAAGASRRMGQPKQLLVYQGKPLIRHMAEVAIATPCDPIVVVLGAHAAAIRPHLADLPLQCVENPDWATGMASSIRCGLTHIQQLQPQLAAVTVMVGDQPLVSSQLLGALIERYQIERYQREEVAIVASAYGQTVGVPALFHRRLFPALQTLQGDTGAKPIIAAHADQCATIPFPTGAIDWDTPDDYAQWLATQ